MSDDRINQLENLYAAPAGSPGETLFGGQGLLRNTGNLIAAPVRGLVQGTGQLALQGMQLSEEYQQSQDIMAAYTAPGDAAKPLKDMVADEQLDIEDTKNRQLALSNATRPNPYTSGIAQNTLYGAADFLTRTVPASVVAGPVGAALVGGGSVGMQTYNEQTAQGIDGDTAAKMGLVQGGTAAAMTFMPMSFGGSFGKRIAAGAILNTGYSIGGNLAAAKVLDDAGYHDQAEQYKNITAAGVLADIVTGSVFGGMHVDGRRLPENPALVDAAAQAASDAKYQVESAPGAPVDTVSTQAHAAAMDMAREQLLRDEPVSLGDIHKDSTFIPIEDPENRAQSLEALREAGYAENNASGESSASLEAQRRLADEQAAGQTRAIIRRDGSVEPLIGVDAVDANARAGEVVVQRGIGANDWTILSHGDDVSPDMARSKLNRALNDLNGVHEGFDEAPEREGPVYHLDMGEDDAENETPAGERVPEARGSENAGNRGSAEQTGTRAREVSPEEAAARQIAEDNPDKLVTYVDENGNEVTERVSDALSRVDQDTESTAKFSDAVKAAVACFARFGE